MLFKFNNSLFKKKKINYGYFIIYYQYQRKSALICSIIPHFSISVMSYIAVQVTDI